jgi:hypothetical protein
MCSQKDQIVIIIADVIMKVQRCYSLPVPHEVTAVIPRAEVRSWRYQGGKLTEARETILNSITISHSPRHENEPHQLNPGPARIARSKKSGTPKADKTHATWKFIPGNRRREPGDRFPQPPVAVATPYRPAPAAKTGRP